MVRALGKGFGVLCCSMLKNRYDEAQGHKVLVLGQSTQVFQGLSGVRVFLCDFGILGIVNPEP